MTPALSRSVSTGTWERINAALLEAARSEGLEDGSQVRVDSTETDILSPTDGGLLRDAVQVLTRLLGAARERLGPDTVEFRDRRRAAKRRALEIPSKTVIYGQELTIMTTTTP